MADKRGAFALKWLECYSPIVFLFGVENIKHFNDFILFCSTSPRALEEMSLPAPEGLGT